MALKFIRIITGRDGVIFGKGFHVVLAVGRVHGRLLCVSVFAYEHFASDFMVSDFSSDFISG